MTRRFPPFSELYSDAMRQPVGEWAAKYGVHEDYIEGLEFYASVASRTQAGVDATLKPVAYNAWTRLFMLGVQIASEAKGKGGACPAENFTICGPPIPSPAGPLANVAATTLLDNPETGTQEIAIFVTEGFVAARLAPLLGKGADARPKVLWTGLHTPDRALDPFQIAISAGIEEGLHAISLNEPEPRKWLNERAMHPLHYANPMDDPMERIVHRDIVALHRDLNLQYDTGEWEKFLTECDTGKRAGFAHRLSPETQVSKSSRGL